MGLGILDQDHLEHVPGTAFLTTNSPKKKDVTAQLPQETASLDNLKQRNGVVLVPQVRSKLYWIQPSLPLIDV